MNEINWKAAADNLNDVIAVRCNEYLREYTKDYTVDREPGREEYSKFEKKVITDWEKTPNDFLDGAAPYQLIDSIEAFDEVKVVFEYLAKNISGKMPPSVVLKLSEFPETEEYLYDRIKEFKAGGNDDLLITSINMLGEIVFSKSADKLISMMNEFKSDDFQQMEAVKTAIINKGSAATEALIDELDRKAKAGSIDEAGENFMAALTEIEKDSENRNERTTECLKNCFRVTENKILGAACLGEAGDERAIPLLRGYLEKNPKSTDKALFLQIKASLTKLGGITDDMEWVQ